MLVLKIEVSKPPKNDLNSDQRHRNDRFLSREGVIFVPKTPKHDHTANIKCIGECLLPCCRGPF